MSSAIQKICCLVSVLIGVSGSTVRAEDNVAGATVSAAALPAASVSAGDYTQDTLTADLTRQLTDRYQATGDLQIELVRPWTTIHAKGPVALSIVETPATLASTLLVRIRLQCGEQMLADTSLLVRTQLMREVWVTRAPTERGATFDAAQFDTRRVDTLHERDTIPTTESTADLSIARAIPAGRFLTWHDVTRRALVRRGQVIEVSAIDGALTVTMKALAMENGGAGETVRLRNLESRKEFTAQVVGEAHAEVRL